MLRATNATRAVASCAIIVLAACGGTGGAGPSASAASITIGTSLVWSGDTAVNGQDMARGYELWAKLVNQHGGILGRQVKLDIRHDDGTVAQTAANYEKLIVTDHVDLLMGPFNDPQTVAASTVAVEHGHPLVEGTGTAPTDFRQDLKNIFAVSLSADQYLTNFIDYVTALPAAIRPTTVAYETDDDPFSEPQVTDARARLEEAGLRTVFSARYSASGSPSASDIQTLVQSHAQVFVQGTATGVPAMTPFLSEFKKQQYTPEAWIATTGPDAGASFLRAFGLGGSEAVMVPNGSWFPAINTVGNAEFTTAYTTTYGVGGSDIPSEAVQGYSVGQVLQQAITAAGTFDKASVLAKLQSGASWNSVQGSVKFAPDGQNTSAQAFLYQWQHGASVVVLPASAAQAKPEFPKPPLS